MGESIIQSDKEHCYICGRNKNADYYGIDCHHIFNGANRKKSEKYGLKVYLCHSNCHLHGVHKNAELNKAIKAIAQEKAMQHYGWSIEDFIKIFGKSYL